MVGAEKRREALATLRAGERLVVGLLQAARLTTRRRMGWGGGEGGLLAFRALFAAGVSMGPGPEIVSVCPPPPPPETVGARFDQPQAGTEEAPDREGHGGLSSLSHF